MQQLCDQFHLAGNHLQGNTSFHMDGCLRDAVSRLVSLKPWLMITFPLSHKFHFYFMQIILLPEQIITEICEIIYWPLGGSATS